VRKAEEETEYTVGLEDSPGSPEEARNTTQTRMGTDMEGRVNLDAEVHPDMLPPDGREVFEL